MRFIGPRDEGRWFHGEEHESGRSLEQFALPGDERHFPRDRSADLEHIKLMVSFDLDTKQVIGRVELQYRAIVDRIQRISLDAEDMVVSSVTIRRHRTNEWRSVNFFVTEAQIVIELGRYVRSGRRFDLSVEYVATPTKGIYFTGPDVGYPDKPVQIWTQGQDTDNHHWFPCWDEPNERLTSEVIVTVPEGWTAISNGRLHSVLEGEDHNERLSVGKGSNTDDVVAVGITSSVVSAGRTFHWVQEAEHTVYLISLVAGEFERVVQQASGPLIEYYVTPGREGDGERAFGNTPAMIRYFEEISGEPYPWAKYAQVAVQDFIFGGMENTSATTQTDLTLHDVRAHIDFSSDFLVSHEAAHQWFGDLITCREWAHGWLNEGFATYLEALWQEEYRGLDAHLWDVMSMAKIYVKERYRRPIVHNQYRVPVDLFDRHMYEKGGVVLHMLRRELGDEAFFLMIRHYVQQCKGKSVLTIDLQRAIEESTGRNLDWFFDQWVYRPGHPSFKVTYQWDEDDKTATLNVVQNHGTSMPMGETGPCPVEAFRCKVKVVFESSRRRHEFWASIRDRQHTLVYSLSERPEMVQFDAGYGVLKELEFNKPKDLLTWQLEHDVDVVGRVEAASGLGRLASNEAIQPLKQAVKKDGFWGVQVEAARALGRIKTEAAMNALIECVGIEHPKARRGVVQALGEFRDPLVADALKQLILEDDSYYVVSSAALSLGKTRQDGAYDVLMDALERESHMDVIRSGAFAGLAELRDERAIDLAKEWTEYGRPQRAREAAISALGKMGENKVEVREKLIDLLDDRWYRGRQFAVSALAALRDDRAIEPLNRLVERERDGRIVRAAREAVTAIRDARLTSDDINSLKKDFEKLEEDNRTLRRRLEQLEDTES